MRLVTLSVRAGVSAQAVAGDEEIMVALNGLPIVALAPARAVFDKPAWVTSAKRHWRYLRSRGFDIDAGYHINANPA